MHLALRLTSYLGLALTAISPLLVWIGCLDMATNTVLLNIGMLLWFGSAIFWIKPDSHQA